MKLQLLVIIVSKSVDLSPLIQEERAGWFSRLMLFPISQGTAERKCFRYNGCFQYISCFRYI